MGRKNEWGTGKTRGKFFSQTFFFQVIVDTTRFPWIVSCFQASHPQTLRVLGDLSALKLVLMSIQASVHWGHQVRVMSVDGRLDYAI